RHSDRRRRLGAVEPRDRAGRGARHHPHRLRAGRRLQYLRASRAGRDVTRACGVCVALLLCAGPVRAQVAAGEIRIAVRGATGLAVAASGVLVGAASQTERRFTTDAAGRFTFDRLPFGVYRIVVSAAGFSDHVETVEIRSAFPQELRVTLAV